MVKATYDGVTIDIDLGDLISGIKDKSLPPADLISLTIDGVDISPSTAAALLAA